MYLLDTNVISEIRKIHHNKADSGVTKWFYGCQFSDLFLNDIILLEMQKGYLLKNRKDAQQGQILKLWIEYVTNNFAGRILPISQEICLKCAELHIPNPRPQFDSLIASTALVHNLILVTDNTKDFQGIDGLKIHNPFTDKV